MRQDKSEKPKHDSPAPATVRVAYHAGPPALGFGGRRWERGVPQTLSADEWARLRARPDYNDFEFQTEE